MADRRSSVVFLGNDAQLSATLNRIEGRLKALSGQAEAEGAKMAAASDVAGKRFGDAFEHGTSRAGNALTKLSALGASWGIPFTESLDKMGKQLEEAETKTQKLGAAMESLGKVTVVGGLAAFAASAYEGVKAAEKFQTSLTTIQSNSDIAAAAAKKIGSAFLSTAGHSTFSAGEMASSFGAVAGQLKLTEGHALNAAQALKVETAAADLAEATHSALANTTADLSGVMQAYGLKVNQAAGASNILFNTSKAIGAPVDQVAQAVERLHGRLGNLAPTLTDTSTLMAELAQHGITGSRGIMQVNTALQTMISPSKNVRTVLRDLGVDLFNSRGQFVGMQSAIQQLQPKLAGLTQQQQLFVAQTLFGRTSGQAMLQVIQAGIPAYQRATATVQRHNAVQAAADAQSKTLHGQMETLKATVEDLATKFGLFLIPKLEATGQAISSVINWLGKHKAAAEAVAAVITGVLGTAVAVFAYTKAVAFVGATKDMVVGMSKVASFATGGLVPALGQAETANSAAGASFTAVGTDAEAAAGQVRTQTSAMVGAVQTADGEIETANDAAAASFRNMVPAIAAVALAMQGLHQKFTNAQKSTYVQGFLRANGMSPSQAQSFYNQHGGGSGGGGAGGSGLPGNVMSLLNPATPTGGPVPVPSSGSNAMRIAGALKAQGFSNVAIAGILGNLAQETGGGNLNAINPNETGPSGLGIEQATQGRRAALMAYAAQHHESATGLPAQIGFLVQELRTDFHNVFTKIQNAPSAAAAARIFDMSPAAGGFEGGTDPGGIREKAAAQAMQMLAGGGRGSSNSKIAQLMNNISSGKTSTTAAHTSTIPVAVATMLSTAQSLVGTPYNKGGHDAAYDPIATLKKIGIDCSGFVSRVLHSGGVNLPISNTEGLPNYLQKGKGKYVTVYDRNTGDFANQHTLIDIMGKFFESGGNKKYNPSGNVTQLTAKQAAGELAGGGFNAYHPILSGKLATTAQLKALGVSGVSSSGSPVNIQNLIDGVKQGIAQAAQAMLQKLADAIQNGTSKTLSTALGLNTSRMIGVQRTTFGTAGLTPAGWGKFTEPLSEALTNVFQKLSSHASTGQINRASTGLIAKGLAGSAQDKAFDAQVLNLMATGQKKLAEQLVAAHKQAMQALGQEMYADQKEHDAQVLSNQTTALKDQTQAITDATSAMQTHFQDETTLMQDQTNAVVQRMSDIQTIINDKMSAMVQSIQDVATVATDRSSAVVDAINDQTQIQVDQIGEKGLYGLNLVAQQLRVNADQVKAFWDRVIDNDQTQLDTLKQQANIAENAAKINLDQVTAAENLLVSQAQQRYDTVVLQQNAKMAAAQAHVDAIQLSMDTTKIAPAQIAYDMHANAPKSVQDVFQSQLDSVTGSANKTMAGIQATLAGIDKTATAAIGNAGLALTTIEGNAADTIQNAKDTVDSINNYWSGVLATASATLTGDQNAGNQAEATANSGASISGANASTQFAGGGVVINQYGLDMSNATVIGNSVSWALRTSGVGV